MKNRTQLTIQATPIWKLPKGHQDRRNGAGVHGDRRTKRKRTRGARLRSELRLQDER